MSLDDVTATNVVGLVADRIVVVVVVVVVVAVAFKSKLPLSIPFRVLERDVTATVVVSLRISFSS